MAEIDPIEKALAECGANSTSICPGKFDLIQKIELHDSRDSDLKLPAIVFRISNNGEQQLAILVNFTKDLLPQELKHFRFQDLELSLADQSVASNVFGEAVYLAATAGVVFTTQDEDRAHEDLYKAKASRVRKEILDVNLGEEIAELLSSMVADPIKTAVSSERDPSLLYIMPEKETRRGKHLAQIASIRGVGSMSSAATFQLS